jgi:hypothetical protein
VRESESRHAGWAERGRGKRKRKGPRKETGPRGEEGKAGRGERRWAVGKGKERRLQVGCWAEILFSYFLVSFRFFKPTQIYLNSNQI